LTLELYQPIYFESVTIDHIPRHLAIDIRSAPKNFQVFAYDKSFLQKKYVYLVKLLNNQIYHDSLFFFIILYLYNIRSILRGTYKINGSNHIQTFNASEDFRKRPAQKRIVQFIGLEILDNNGKSEYTCLYRFRVHGSVLESN